MVYRRVAAKAASAASRSLLAESITFETARISAKNRFLKGAMTERLCSFDPENMENISTRGYPSQTLINVYEKWAYGNYGVVLTGNVMVDPASGNLIVSKENDSPRLRELLKQLADTGKKNGTVFIAQIGHAGRQTPISINPQPWSASDVQLTKGPYQYGKPKALTTEQVQTEVIDRFVHTAKAIYEAGFHGIELHAAHGYLFAQFLSPTTNLRSDRYGGPIENRALVVLEIYDAIRKEIPASTGFAIGIKLNSVEFQEGGLRTEDSKKFAVLLEQKGFDFIEVSGGNYEQLGWHHSKESTKKREAYFLEFAGDIKKALKNLRVYVIGGFRTTEGMAAAVRDGATDGIGLARPATAEFDLPTVLIEGKGDSAPDTNIPESDLWLAVVACDTQMWQAGQTTVEQAKGDVNYGIVDLSCPESNAKYSEAAGPFAQKAVEMETSGKSFYGVLQYPLKTKARPVGFAVAIHHRRHPSTSDEKESPSLSAPGDAAAAIDDAGEGTMRKRSHEALAHLAFDKPGHFAGRASVTPISVGASIVSAFECVDWFAFLSFLIFPNFFFTSCMPSIPTETLLWTLPKTTPTTTFTATSTSTSTSTTTTTTASITSTKGICPTDWILHVDGRGECSCYVLVSGPLASCAIGSNCDGFVGGCNAARTACESLGAELVSIYSQGDNNFVYGLANPGVTISLTPNIAGYPPSRTEYTCIGLRDVSGVGGADVDNYLWPDMTPPSPYSNWYTGAPNAPPHIVPEVCVIMYTNPGGTLGDWDNYPCTLSMRNGICMKAATLITVG